MLLLGRLFIYRKPNIPQDYADQLASIEGGTVENVNFNTKDQYYTNFTDANDTALNNLLLTVAQKLLMVKSRIEKTSLKY